MFRPGISVERRGKNKHRHCYANVEHSADGGACVSTDPQPSKWSENIEVHDKERVLEEKIDDWWEGGHDPRRLGGVALSALFRLCFAEI